MSDLTTKIGIAMIGAGGRSFLLEHLFKQSDKIKLISIYDPDMARAKERVSDCSIRSAVENVKICSSYQDAIDSKGVDWVCVFSPNANHAEHVIYAFKAGKDVFSEKPLATKIKDCQKMYEAHKKSGRMFATGFVLRYSVVYQKVKEVLDSGRLGKILSIDANENITPDHGSYIMMNWRRFSSISGPHILEKCCHDLDLINWFVGSLPSKVASFGGRDLFIPEYNHMREIKNSNGKIVFKSPWTYKTECASPFTSEKDLMDNQVAIIQFRNNVRVMFQATLSNAIPERRMYFSCTEGTMIVELYSATVKYKRIDDKETTIFKPSGCDGHGGGDIQIMEALADSMLNRAEPKCSGEEGLESSVTAIAIDEAREKGKIIDVDKIWAKLGR